MLDAPLSVAPLPRLPTAYPQQYWSVHRYEPPRNTRLGMPGSAGSKLSIGPGGLRAT